MPLSYPSPGVYVEEVPANIKPIAGVSTSTPAFIGVVPDRIHLVAKREPTPTDAATFKLVDFALTAPAKSPMLITNWTQFTRAFGDLVGDASVDATNDPNPAVSAGHRNLAQAVYGFFNNGGSRCFVIRVAAITDLDDALKALAAVDEVAIVAAPGILDDSTRDKLVTHCFKTGDRFAILDGPDVAADLTTLTRTAADATPGVAPKRTDLAAWYFPWIKVFDPATKLQKPDGDGLLAVPPSGHMAGIYARVDNARGVHKAPANEPILGALNVPQMISRADQDT
jgi:phage tail sheath protein FI